MPTWDTRKALGAVAAIAMAVACGPLRSGDAGDAPNGPGEPSRSEGQARQLPLDPLTDAERTAASRLVLADTSVRRLAGARDYDVALVELLVEKPPEATPDDPDRPPRMRRLAEVFVSVLGDPPTGVRAVVDLERRAVVEATLIEVRPASPGDSVVAGAAVPISPREVELARRLTLAHPQAASALGARPDALTIEYLPISGVEAELCPSGRCLELLFRRGDTYLTTTAVVDLPTQTVRFRRPAP